MLIRYDNIALTESIRPAAGADIRVFLADVDGQPTATVYSDPLGTTVRSQPFQTDVFGNFYFYANPSYRYRVELSGSGLTTLVLPHVSLPAFPHYLDVRSFGAVGNGAASAAVDTAAFQAAIDQAVVLSNNWSIIGRPSGGTTIKVPYGQSGVYGLTEKLILPGNKNIRFAAPSPRGVRLEWGGTGDFMFRLAAGQRALEFDGLVLHKGGIEVEGSVRNGPYIFRNGQLIETPDYAVKTLGASVINVRFQNWNFNENAGDVHQGFIDSDLWVFDHCGFVRSSKANLVFKGTGLVVYDSNFETRNVNNAADADQPYIQILPASGLIDLQRVRFGAEQSSIAGITGAAPREAILFGEIGSLGGSPVSRVAVHDCHFLGSNSPGPDATSGDCGIRLNCAVNRLSVTDPKLATRGYNTAFIREEFYTQEIAALATSVWGNSLQRPMRAANTDSATAVVYPLFSHGGVGWKQDLSHYESVGYAARGGRNLLRDTDDIAASSNWTKTGVTVTKNAAGPDGAANTAFTVEKTATSSSLSADVSPSGAADGKAVVGSVWLKAGTLRFARISLFDTTTNRHVSSNHVLLELTDDLRRYEIPIPAHVASNNLRFLIRPSFEGDTATGGTIIVYGPQLEVGRHATAYHPNAGTTRVGRQFNSLMVGGQYIGYGTAAPGSGRYEVGDKVFNTAPAAGGFVGWVCVTAGSPGTWKGFGGIEA